jgi:hypothetical protein
MRDHAPRRPELNDGSLSSTGQSAPVHRETNKESDQRFRAAFHAAHLSLIEVIAIAERFPAQQVGTRHHRGVAFSAFANLLCEPPAR